jgi:TPR repeat protein
MSIGLADGEYKLKLGAYRQAFEIFLMLAINEEDPAYYKLCEMVLNNQLKDDEIATLEDHLKRSVRGGNKLAAYNLAFIRWHSKGALRNLEEAVELFEEACAHDVPEAYVALARLYMKDGADLPLASGPNIMNLLERGLNHGSIEAAFMLGKFYYDGQYTPRNDSQAFKYLFIAAKQRHEEARKALLVLQAIHPNHPFSAEQEAAYEIIDRIETERGHFR